MGKHISKHVRYPLIMLLTIIGGIYSFTQALQVLLTETNAEKVFSAWNILQHTAPLSSWAFQPLELPVYLLFAKVLGLGTFTSIAVSEFFYLILFCTGFIILKTRDLLNIPNILIWIALTGLPDPVWLHSIQNAPFLILGLLLTPHFLSGYINHHRKKAAIFSMLSLTLTAISLPKPFVHPAHSDAVHETLRALQSVFRADFSQQPLLNFTTGRYFLMTIVLLLIVWSLILTAKQFFKHQYKQTDQFLYAIFIFLTLLWCCLPFSGDRGQKITLCSWLPFGTAILLILIKEDPACRELRFARGRLSLPALVSIFSILTILFSISPIVRSRPASPADRVVIYLTEKQQEQGCCGQSDLALLSVAAKGKITFLTDRDAPGNTFAVLREFSETDKASNFEEIPPYLILIHQ